MGHISVLFRLLYDRYEKKSTIFTSNRPFDEWKKLFRDRVQAMAIISRIAGNAIVVSIKGEDYRIIKERERIKSAPRDKSNLTSNSSLN